MASQGTTSSGGREGGAARSLPRGGTVRRIATGALTLALLLAPHGPALAQPEDFHGVRIKLERITEGLYLLRGRGGNIAVSAGADGVLLVDDQYAPLTDRIRARIARLDAGPIRFVLNTHWHPDHSGGNENLGRGGTLILAHDNVRRRLASGQEIPAIGWSSTATPEAGLPVITFRSDVTLHFNDEEIHAFHVGPAHTDGDSIVHFRRANVVHLGDLYMYGAYPFIDASSGGSVDGVIAALERALELMNDETIVIPGHGRLSNRRRLGRYLEMLVDVRDRVATLVAAGRSRDEILAAPPTAEWDAEFGGGYFKPKDFVEFVYDTLAAPPAGDG